MGIFDVFTGKPAKDAAQQNSLLYQQYGQNAQNAINQGEQQATGAYNQAIGAYAPLSALGAKYGGATSLQLDALGVNGPAGVARARAAFQAGPGYNWQVNQATDAAARKAAALGIAGSGNTLDEIRNRAQNIANTEYNNWLGNLGTYINPELGATGGAASGIAGGYRSLGDLYGTNAQNRANIFGNVTSGQAAANQQLAQSQLQGSSSFWNALGNLGGILGGIALKKWG